MNRPVLSALAEGDLAEIWITIATTDIETADRFVDEIREQMQRLADQPLIGRLRPEFGSEARSFVVRPYVIIYRSTEQGVGIARVVHGARNLNQIVMTDDEK